MILMQGALVELSVAYTSAHVALAIMVVEILADAFVRSRINILPLISSTTAINMLVANILWVNFLCIIYV